VRKKISVGNRMGQNRRLEFLDGLRGWAAFCVFLGHLGLTSSEPMAVLLSSLGRVRLHFLLMNGYDAVILFFLISGAALSYKFFGDHDRKSVIRMAQFRYVRLFIPVFFSVVFMYVFLRFGLMVDPNRATFDLSFFGFLQNLYNAFFSYDLYTVYNPNLWTIPIELLGSFLVFSTLCLFGTSKLRYILYGLCIILLLKTFYVCFVMGLLVCDIYCQILKLAPKKFPRIKALFDLLPLGFIFCALLVCTFFYAPREEGYYVFYFIKMVNLKIGSIMLPTPYKALPFFIFIVIFFSSLLQKLFSSRLFLFMGRISFALYLFHWPIIWFIFSEAITKYIQEIFSTFNILFNPSWLQVFLCVFLVVSYAYWFTVFIEERLLKQVKTFMFNADISPSKVGSWVFRKIEKFFQEYCLSRMNLIKSK